jgi:sialate O-acetylesterase
MYYDADTELLSLNLSGRWKIHLGDNKEWKSSEFKDDDWQRIPVPSEWDNHGLENYDGYAWYRVKFRVPGQFVAGDLFLSLGKIDDEDYVYLNGKYIGSAQDLKKDAEYRRSGWEFNARRLYKIPDGLLKTGEVNTLAVRVYDGQQRGGIYEGPIGIMSEENYRKYRNKHYSSQSFWDFFTESFYTD